VFIEANEGKIGNGEAVRRFHLRRRRASAA